ncbi:epimerase [Arthrobacter sp. MYb227]|uniref:DUF1304 domain-containing protein n=1 Tax=Arthrobacter sp. MYb227 TaxID=1848601 RepID=UPI000CFB046B|nr:DUF1304 domain-containing protein [Arthrobacter sp. MYb227]PQZ95025.1 epimerase [Arthrobacter sp. MYb227]
MLIISVVLGGLAALIHLYIFALESLFWDKESTHKIFGIRSTEQAAYTRQLAFNQGFYNLFLAIMTVVGGVLLLQGTLGAGAALFLAGTGSMVASGLILMISAPNMLRAALIQLVVPALAGGWCIIYLRS